MMPRLTRLAQRLLADRRGATAVEYGLIVALVVIAIIAAVMSVASVTTTMWNNVNTRVDDVT
ncbi:Flp family type IVb pilin [Sphingomonas spermidinifaciens]|uniref:Flp family type IVb pilin n=2 Tax=Sphingomonas spermidinifaciens TaxID=1141889 RepID=A0A2A4B4J8_9SPHN|nr:Flp family type IVb pilin [Sphingomonas spermidinifaciens]PCD04123.1 Flp family type IVb pilin [Sphingomonas spermidinifaciens]